MHSLEPSIVLSINLYFRFSHSLTFETIDLLLFFVRDPLKHSISNIVASCKLFLMKSKLI